MVKPAAKRGGAREGWAAGACVGIDLGTTNSAVAQQGHEAPPAPWHPQQPLSHPSSPSGTTAAPVAPRQPPLAKRPQLPLWPRVESPHAASML